jgi:predicted nucleotidyltransferase
MEAAIDQKRVALAAICRRYGVARLEVFGSAARGGDFDPNRSDADFLVTFKPAARNDLAAFADLKEALRLARYFGTSPAFWMGIQAQYDLERTEDGLGAKLGKIAPVREAKPAA